MSPRISYLIKWVERGVRVGLDDSLRPLGVTTPEYTALSVLRQRSGLSSAQLARRAFVSNQAMNQIVITLERRGFIERTEDPANNKILRAKLTSKGSETLRACDRATADIEASLLTGLTSEQVSALRELLQKCAASLGNAIDRAG